MMGGAPPSDPRLAAMSDALMILRLISDPAGANKVVETLGQAHADVLAKLDQAQQKHDETARGLAQQKAAQDATAVEQQKTARATEAAAADLNKREAALALCEAEVTAKVAQLKLAGDKLANDGMALVARREEIENVLVTSRGELDSMHATRMAVLDAREVAIVDRDKDADARDAALRKAEATAKGRATALDKREAAAELANQAAAATQAEYERKLANLRALV